MKLTLVYMYEILVHQISCGIKPAKDDLNLKHKLFLENLIPLFHALDSPSASDCLNKTSNVAFTGQSLSPESQVSIKFLLLILTLPDFHVITDRRWKKTIIQKVSIKAFSTTFQVVKLNAPSFICVSN